MIAEAVDRIVAAVAPVTALKRVAARQLLTRGYDAAKQGRFNNDWRASNRSADSEMLSDADITRARARDLVRNNAYARGVLRAHVRNVVGCGIRPQSTITFKNGKQRKPLNDEIEAVFDRWQRHADVTGRLSFYEIQRLVYSEMKEAGECLVRFVRSSDRSRPVPMALEMIEADRLAADHMFPRGRHVDSGNEVRRGVEIDATGRPVAYHLYNQNPADVYSYSYQPVRVPAEQVIHLYNVERIGQTRGISAFAPVVQWMRDLDQYVTTEMKSAMVASCFSVAIKSMSAEADGGIAGLSQDDTAEADGAKFEQLKTGLVARLFPDEEVQVINPARSHAEQDVWVKLFQRAIAVGSGLSYERLTRDYSQTDFSSNRASDLEDRKEFRIDQDFLIEHLCVPVWHRFIASAVDAGAIRLLNAVELLTRYEEMTAHEWQAPGWEWVDPKNESMANDLALANGTTTLKEVLSKKGNNDWHDVLRQRARERQFQMELDAEFGLTPVAAEPATTDAEDTSEEDTADAEEVAA